MVDPLADRTNLRKQLQPAKLLSVEGLKKALRFVQLSWLSWLILMHFDFTT